MKRLAALLLLSVSACGPLDLPLDPDLADTQAPTAVLELLDASGAVITGGRVDAGAGFALSGARSTDIGGVVDQYEWLVPGLSRIRTGGPTLAVTEIDGVDFGTGVYTFGLRVSDDSGNQSALTETTVTVGDPDPPTAVLDVLDGVGALQSDGRIEAGDPFSLGGARSTDVGGSVVRYEWHLPGAVTVTTDAPTLAVTEIVDEGFELGEHTFGLRVSDDSGNQSTLVETTVTIQDTRRPTAVLRILDAIGEVDADGRIEVGQPLSLGGEGSTDSGGPIAQYEWRLPGGLTVTTDVPTLAVTQISDEGFGLGVHTFGLVVVDAAGNESVAVETTVTIVDTQAPTAVLEVLDATGAVDADQRFGPGDVFSLSGSRSTDGEGSIAQYRWVLPDGQVVTTDSPTLAVTELTDAGFAVGEHTFGLRVVDESGNESSLAEVVVTIVDTQAPTAVLDVLDALGDIDADGRVEVGEDFSLSGARSVDTGGQVVRYDWILPSGLTVITDTPTLEVTLISDSGFGVGPHTFGLRVTDGSGNVSQLVQTTVTVVDTQAPTAVLEVVNAAGDVDGERSFRLGETFSLRGSRSVDVGGQITRYRWILPSGQSVVTDTPTLAVTDLFGGSLEVGVSTFGLQVTDDSGNESTLAQVAVTLLEPDTTAPTAVLSAVYPDGRPVIGTVPQGAAFLLTGVRSTDVGGVIVRYDWRLPNGQAVTTDRPSLAVTEVAGPFGPGEQTFGLTVTDDSGNESVLAQVRVIIGL